MTAEDKLKEWYENSKSIIEYSDGMQIYDFKGVEIRPEHIDLIANLVVERLRKVKHDR